MPRRPPARRARVAAAVGAITLLGSLTGCGLFGNDDDQRADGPDPAPATTTSTTTVPVRAGKGPDLVDAGAEPRRPLRLALEPGSTTTVTITTDLSVAQDDGSVERKVDPPPIRETIEYRVGKTDDTGNDIDFEITAMEVATSGTTLPPKTVARLNDAFEPAVGLTGHGRLTTRGALEDAAFDLDGKVGRGLDDTVRAQIEQLPAQLGALAPRLPAEPVGVGAEWTTTETVTLAGIAVEQTTSFEVDTIGDGVVTYRSRTTARATDQTVPADAVGADGVDVTLETATYEGTGKGTLRLDRPVSEAQSSVHGDQTLSIGGPDTTGARVQQVVRIETRVRTERS